MQGYSKTILNKRGITSWSNRVGLRSALKRSKAWCLPGATSHCITVFLSSHQCERADCASLTLRRSEMENCPLLPIPIRTCPPEIPKPSMHFLTQGTIVSRDNTEFFTFHGWSAWVSQCLTHVFIFLPCIITSTLQTNTSKTEEITESQNGWGWKGPLEVIWSSPSIRNNEILLEVIGWVDDYIPESSVTLMWKPLTHCVTLSFITSGFPAMNYENKMEMVNIILSHGSPRTVPLFLCPQTLALLPFPSCSTLIVCFPSYSFPYVPLLP